ncbi:MAG: hypothetical protein KBD43_14235 [Saprospiraceae bacterium]|nr:hypothetical protein [Saprospiraceae bacterium]
MDKSPNKEMIAFFGQCIGLGGVLFLIMGTVLIKFLEMLGIVQITI